MSEEQEKEYAEQLKISTKELIDGISTDSKRDQKILRMIYGFVRAGFLECRAAKEVRND